MRIPNSWTCKLKHSSIILICLYTVWGRMDREIMLLASLETWYHISRKPLASTKSVSKSLQASIHAINQWIQHSRQPVVLTRLEVYTVTGATQRKSLIQRATPESSRPETTTPLCLICVTTQWVHIPRRNLRRRLWAEQRWRFSTTPWTQRLDRGTAWEKSLFFRRRAGYWV